MPPRGPRNDWNRPPMQNFPQPNGPPGHQSGPMMQGPPRGPPPPQMGKLLVTLLPNANLS